MQLGYQSVEVSCVRWCVCNMYICTYVCKCIRKCENVYVPMYVHSTIALVNTNCYVPSYAAVVPEIMTTRSRASCMQLHASS